MLLACEANPWAVEAEAALAPRDVYFIWFADAAACMGHPEEATRERFDRIDWYQGLVIEHPTEGQALALWTRPHRITIRSDQTRVQLVIKHELVHDFLQDPGHPSPHFLRCAGR